MGRGNSRNFRRKAMSSNDYAGDVSPSDAFEALKSEADALLVDVRTKAEWSFVGVPNLAPIGKAASFIEWVRFPDMKPNRSFLKELEKITGRKKDAAVFFLCRSGQRSQKAAIAATAAGFTRAYNVDTGFEGPLDAERQRAKIGGWKADGLPWGQT